jgi:hypothetical protein
MSLSRGKQGVQWHGAQTLNGQILWLKRWLYAACKIRLLEDFSVLKSLNAWTTPLCKIDTPRI